MSHQDQCGTGPAGCFLSAAAGIVFAALAGILFAFSLLPNILICIAIAAVLSVVLLILLAVGIFSCGGCYHAEAVCCLKKNTTRLLAGITGTLLTATAAFAFPLATGSVVSIILVTAGGFFFAFMLAAFLVYLKCLTR